MLQDKNHQKRLRLLVRYLTWKALPVAPGVAELPPPTRSTSYKSAFYKKVLLMIRAQTSNDFITLFKHL